MKRLFYSMFMAICAMLLFTGCQKENPDIVKFTVTFNSVGGSEVEAIQVKENEKLSKPTNPTKGEFIFVGWFKEATWVNAWDFDKDVVTKNITLYAKWTTVTYTVTFNTNEGSEVAPLTVAKGAAALKPLTPIKTNAAFDNWYREVTLTNVYDFSAAVNSNITLYAKWITVTLEGLQTLVNGVRNINTQNYTVESVKTMNEKLDAARLVLQSEYPTSQQIITSYTELSAAINALVARPHRAVVDIYIGSVVDGMLYVNQGQTFSLYAYAMSATDDVATDARVTFTYDASKLATWSVNEIQTDERGLSFLAKSTITPGETISIIVKSAENPAISKTVTLKVAGQGELKTMFINAVNALPDPDNISYEHYEAIDKARGMYYNLSYEDKRNETVIAAYKKIIMCEDAYGSLPQRLKYSFKGNICTITSLEGVSEEGETRELTFIANGTFPAGTYTQNDWESDGTYRYYQQRISFKSDGTGSIDYREAKDANGTEATAWRLNDEKFTYTNSGSQAAGGMFIITFKDKEPPVVTPDPGTKSIRSTSSVRAPYASFKMIK